MREVLHIVPGHEPQVVKTKHDITLREMQGLVQGYITLWPSRVIWEGKSVQMIVDEEGAVNGSFLNHHASDLAGKPVFGCVFLALDKDMD